MEFRPRLGDSSRAVPGAVRRLGLRLSLRAFAAAYMPFTPNDSEQRSHLTCYRGCWHVISRCFFPPYSHRDGIPSAPSSSRGKGLYNLPASLVHAASLRQASAHCGIFLAAASRRSLGRISVPMCPSALSGRVPVIATVGRYPAVWLMGRGPPPRRARRRFPPALPIRGSSSGITLCFHRLSPSSGRVIHALLTSPPLSLRTST